MECNICKESNIKSLYLLNNLEIKKCKNCGHIFSVRNQEINNSDLYKRDYYKETHQNFFADCYSDYGSRNKKSKKLKNFSKTIKLIKKYSTDGRLLDVGCATGIFLDMCQHSDFNVSGVELSTYAADYARNNFSLDISNTTLEESNFEDGSFDVITMLDLIEHVPDPSKVLEKSNALLKQGGFLYILTVNENSLMTKLADLIYKVSRGKISKPVELLHPVHHIHHFSKKTLKKTLKNNGFEIVYTKKSEMPAENIEGSKITKTIARVMYVFSTLLHWQHEISVLAIKK